MHSISFVRIYIYIWLDYIRVNYKIIQWIHIIIMWYFKFQLLFINVHLPWQHVFVVWSFPTVFVTSYSLGSKVAKPCGPNQFYHCWFWASNHFNVGQYTGMKYPIRSSESYLWFIKLCSGILQGYWCVLRNVFITIITCFHLSTQGWTRDLFCPKPPKDMQKYQGPNESFGQISLFWSTNGVLEDHVTVTVIWTCSKKINPEGKLSPVSKNRD